MSAASLRNLSALVVLALTATVAAHADSTTISANAVPAVTLYPSSDTVSLNPSSIMTVDGNGNYAFRTGTFYVGDSPIPNQVIPFSFTDTITLNGITRDITVMGEDDVTTETDALVIYAGDPVSFGDFIFQLSATSTPGGGVGANLPFVLSADISQTPEPTSLALLGTGALAFAVIGYTKSRA